MIDEIKLLTELQDELANVRAKYWESDTDSFYSGMCSALEEVIILINKQPTIEKKLLNKMFGAGGYIDTDSVRNDKENVQTIGYMPPMKEQILHYFRNLYYADIREYNKLSTGLDKLAEESRAKAIDETCLKIFNHLLSEIEWNRVLVEDWNALAEDFKEIAEQMKGDNKNE